MTRNNEPVFTHLRDFTADYDRGDAINAVEVGRERMEAIPWRFRSAVPAVAATRQWVHDLVRSAAHSTPCKIKRGESLLLSGPVGTGKTYEAYGAMRALLTSGALGRVSFTAVADLYGKLRDFSRSNVEALITAYERANVLVLDDLGAAKWSEWTDEINYRLIDYRYEHGLPTMVTTNVPLDELEGRLGQRVASRLMGMCDAELLDGADRRGGEDERGAA